VERGEGLSEERESKILDERGKDVNKWQRGIEIPKRRNKFRMGHGGKHFQKKSRTLSKKRGMGKGY